MSQRRCCLCWNTRKKYREVVPPMKEKHSKSCRNLLGVDITNNNGTNGSLLFCFICFDTVARLSLITDKLNEIQTLFKIFTISFSKQVLISRKTSTGVVTQNCHNASFKNIAERIVAPSVPAESPAVTVSTENVEELSEKNEEDKKEINEFENFALNSCVENYEYSPLLRVPKGATRVPFFQKALTKTEGGTPDPPRPGSDRGTPVPPRPGGRGTGKPELRVILERLKLLSGKTHGIYYCGICRKELKSQSGLTVHNSCKHGIFKNRPALPVSNSLGLSGVKTVNHKPTSSLPKCRVCFKRFLSQTGLHRHTQTVHAGIKYPCQQCDMTFSQPSRLTMHIKVIHLKEIIFECNVCGKHFANNRNRRIHLETQHGIKRSVVNNANKDHSFTSNSSTSSLHEAKELSVT